MRRISGQFLISLCVCVCVVASATTASANFVSFPGCANQVGNFCQAVDVPPDPGCSTRIDNFASGTAGRIYWRDWFAEADGINDCTDPVDELSVHLSATPTQADGWTGNAQVTHGNKFSNTTNVKTVTTDSKASASASDEQGTCVRFESKGQATFRSDAQGAVKMTVVYPSAPSEQERCR